MMPPDPEQHMVVIRPAADWAAQARSALDELGEFGSLRSAAKTNYGAFCRLVEALHALAPLTGRPPDAEMMALAGMVPVDVAVDGD